MSHLDGLPEVLACEPDDELLASLRQVQHLLIRHPLAAQAAFRALVREGRRYGATPEGAARRAELAGSELVEKGRVVWEVVTLKTLEEDGDSVLPTQLLDALARAAHRDHLEPLLGQLFSEPDS